jgi:hypothetical protein
MGKGGEEGEGSAGKEKGGEGERERVEERVQD